MDLLVDVGKQVPSLAVLVFVVVYFLRFLDAQGRANADRLNTAIEAQDRTLEAHSKAIDHLATEIAASQRVNAKMTAVLMYHDATVKGLDGKMMGSIEELMQKIQS